MRELYISFTRSCEIDIDAYTLKKTVRDAVLATLIHEAVNNSIELSVTFTDNACIRRLNRAHRNIDKHTDVLSFPMYERDELSELPSDEPLTLGDIVISVERAKEQAEELGNTPLREIAFLAIHSTLHLLGYDHERSLEEDREQCRIQREIIENLHIEDENE